MGMLTYVIKISRKIFLFSYLFVDIYLQDWTPFCVDGVFTCDTFHSSLRKINVFPLKPDAPEWNKERPKTAIRRYRL